jgi:hypothetical protein
MWIKAIIKEGCGNGLLLSASLSCQNTALLPPEDPVVKFIETQVELGSSGLGRALVYRVQTFSVGRWKCSVAGQWWWLPDAVNELNATELCN